jgi:uncharacterized membrane protein YdjX (TVP38/TMEM64 family)
METGSTVMVEPEVARSRSGRIQRLLLIGGAIVGLYLLGREFGAAVPRFAEWVGSLGVWGPIVFIGGYAAAVVAFAPASILTLAGGAIFGLVRGTAYVFVAATLGSALAFLVSRYLARSWVEGRFAKHPRFTAIDRAMAQEGRKIVFLVRLSPVFPYNVLNYALGLTRISFRDYLLGCIGMIPGTLLYVYYGKLAGDVASLAAGVQVERGPEYYAVLMLGLVATIWVTTVVTRAARRALAEVTQA